jgi:UDP-N-acetylglucosamine 1-carboxyvinyltransferase
MGASIKVDGQLAVVQGVEQLKGAPVKADDLRAGAAMLIAGLAATGTTEVEDILHIDRGYENFETNLCMINADIVRTEK